MSDLFRKYSLLFKGILCLTVLYFLISSDKLDLRKLSMIYAKPQIFFGLWLCLDFWGSLNKCTSLACLVENCGVSIDTTKATSLTAIGLFFSSFLPGSVSGDAIKAFYIVNENKQISKTQVFSTILMDRIIGLYSIFTIASCTMLFSFSWEELKTHLSFSPSCYSCFCRSHPFLFYFL